VTRFARILFDEARRSGVVRPIFEVRILKAGRDRVVSGYFDAPELAAQAVASRDGLVEAIYVTPNPAVVDCFARAANKLKIHAEATTADAQIVKRDWFLIDVDAVRPKGVSSTNAQHDAALAKAHGIRAFLEDLGFPAPILGDSGNGAHLMYRIDLANDDAVTTLIKHGLEALAHRFDDPTASPNAVKVDTTVHNAARIWKMYGTMACKGDNLPEQPHRRAVLLDTPHLDVCSRDVLAVLASMLPQPANESRPAARGDFDLMAWLRARAVEMEIGEEKQLDGGGWIRELRPCPWGDHEKDWAAYVGQRSSGAIIAGCRHDRCKDKRWSDLRDVLEPGWRSATKTAGNRPPPHTDDDAPPRLRVVPDGPADEPKPTKVKPQPSPLTVDVLDFVGEDEPTDEDVISPEDWIVPSFVPRAGVTILGGPPKIGKTFLLLDLAIAVASGQKLCGHWPTFQGRVLALLEEDTKRRIRMRLWRMARGRGVDPRSLTGQLRLATMTGFRLDSEDMVRRLEQEITMYRPDVLLIDALARVHSADENDRTAMRAVTVPLQALCTKYGIAIVLVHHFRKQGLGDDKRRSGDLLRGSSDLLALARSVIGVQRLDDRRGFQVDAQGNDGEVQPAIVELENGKNDRDKSTILLRYVGPTGESRAAEDGEKIFALILAAMPDGLGQRALRDACGMGKDRMDAAVDHLHAQGRIFRTFARAPWRAREMP
jgi:hypothetical protein